MRKHLLVSFVLLASPILSFAEWPQYRGPHADGTTSVALKAPNAIGDETKEAWRRPLNTGFSSFAADDTAVYTIVRREVEGIDRETLLALDAATGEERWANPLAIIRYGHDGGNAGARGNDGGDGPRSTPSVQDGLVYVIDSDLVVSCFAAADGNLVWSHNVIKEYNGRNIKWKNAASPLLEGNYLYMAGGGEDESFLAFHRKTGKLAWKTGDALMTHATPVAETIGGQRQIIFFNQDGLTAFTPDSGKQLWHYDFPFNVSSAASPVVHEDLVYVTAGYGVGAAVVKVSQHGGEWKAEEQWRDKKIANHWSTPVCHDGYLYGLYGFKKYGKAPLACYDIKTGELKWEESGFGPGHLIRVKDQLLVLGDAGQLVLADADPKGYKEIKRAELLDGKCWTTPILAHDRVFIRSAKEAVCLDVSGR